MALVVMALAVGVFGAAFPSASQAIARAKHIDQASDECQKALDYYRQIGETSIELSLLPAGASRATAAITPTTDLPGASGEVLFRRVDDSYAETTTDTGRLRVDATVRWSGVGSDRGEVTLTTLIVEHPR